MYVTLLSIILSIHSYANVIQQKLPSIDLAYEFLIESKDEELNLPPRISGLMIGLYG